MIYTIKNKIFPSNTYIVSDQKNSTCLIIDPGFDKALIEEKLVELNIIPIGILSTHGHFDHIANVAYFQNKFTIPFFIHRGDLKVLNSANFFLKIAKIDQHIKIPKPNVIFEEKFEAISIGDFKLEIYNFPGHSDGGIIIKIGKNLFTGDLIYKSGLGFNNFPGEKKIILRESIIEIFKIFGDDFSFFPGHGSSETIGFLKKHNLRLHEFLSQKQN